MNIIEDLRVITGGKNVIKNEPMSRHTTFRIGGNADVFVTPDSDESLIACVEYVKSNNIPYYIVGNGSNLLVRDNGFRGVIIQLYKGFSGVMVKDNVIIAKAGTLLSAVAKTALNNSLTGMECLSGIPGTIGGAICMNAGAYGGEMKDIVVETKVINNGRIEIIDNSLSEFGYRTSRIMRENMIVVETTIKLEMGNKEEIQNKMKELMLKRNEKQPVELPSAGSTFKRPKGYFAAKLIDDSGLRGFSVGQAQISPKHCGFVVNNGGATAKEVIELMDKASQVVFEKFGVKLEPEIRIIGE